MKRLVFILTLLLAGSIFYAQEKSEVPRYQGIAAGGGVFTQFPLGAYSEFAVLNLGASLGGEYTLPFELGNNIDLGLSLRADFAHVLPKAGSPLKSDEELRAFGAIWARIPFMLGNQFFAVQPEAGGGLSAFFTKYEVSGSQSSGTYVSPLITTALSLRWIPHALQRLEVEAAPLFTIVPEKDNTTMMLGLRLGAIWHFQMKNDTSSEDKKKAKLEKAEAKKQRLEEERQREKELAEQKRLEEEARRAEEEKVRSDAELAEQKRQEEESRLAEEKRIAEEAEKARLAEEERLAREAEEIRLREEEARLAEEQAEQERLAREEAEAARLAEEERLRQEEEARLAEEERLRQEEEARIAEEKRLAEESKKSEPTLITERLKLKHILYFSKNGAVFTGLSRSQIRQNEKTIEEAVEIIKQHPDCTVYIEGYAQNISGTKKENQTACMPLSLWRAEYVKKELIKRGIAKEKIEAVGMGDANPIANPNDRSTWWKNRRVEFVITYMSEVEDE